MSRPTLTFVTAPSGRILGELAPGVVAGEIVEGHFAHGASAVFWLHLPMPPPALARQQFPAKDIDAAKRGLRMRASHWFEAIGVLPTGGRVACDDPAMVEDTRAARLERFDRMVADQARRPGCPGRTGGKP